MNEFDQALINLREDGDDVKKQSAFYDLVLNATFFVPILPGSGGTEETGVAKEVLPVITEAQGKDYLMLFSSLERMQDWVKGEEEVRHISVPGHVLALSTREPLHWALNAGTDYSKQFYPEEIAWLREAVERCNAEAASRQEGCCE